MRKQKLETSHKGIIRVRAILELSSKYKDGQNRKIRNRYVFRKIDKRCTYEIVKKLINVYGETLNSCLS